MTASAIGYRRGREGWAGAWRCRSFGGTLSDGDRGQVNTSAAEVYDSLFVPALFGGFADAVADAAKIDGADKVIDIACGTGALTRAVRDRTTGRVVGVDVNPGMLAIARRHGGEIDYIEGDGQDLAFGGDEFDVATSQFGLMFFPDPAKGLAEMARVARRGAVVVWDSIDRSDGYAAMQDLFRNELGADAASSLDAPFAMGTAGTLDGHFREAGVGDVSYQSIKGRAHFDSIDQWVTTEIRGWTLSDSVTEDRLAELIEVARERLGAFTTAEGCAFGITAKVATWQ